MEPALRPARSFFDFVGRPLDGRARVALFALTIPLLLSFAAPLWRIRMEAAQYPRGLWLDIYSYTVEGGDGGEHIQEINTLNHYIGMQHIDRRALSDLDWMPFAIGVLALLTLRVALIGSVRSLVDLTVISLYTLTFAFARFVYRLYRFGHDLAPDAPVKLKPFTPVIVGTRQIANFTTHSYPQAGALLVGLFAGGLLLVLVVELARGRRAATVRA